MSLLSDKLIQVNTDLRTAIQEEHDQVKAKIDELIAKIAELEGATDAEFDAALEDTKTIVNEIKGIFE